MHWKDRLLDRLKWTINFSVNWLETAYFTSNLNLNTLYTTSEDQYKSKVHAKDSSWFHIGTMDKKFLFWNPCSKVDTLDSNKTTPPNFIENIELLIIFSIFLLIFFSKLIPRKFETKGALAKISVFDFSVSIFSRHPC